MSYFDCPRCGEPFDDDALLTQEVNMLELEDAALTVNCHNCGESFEVARVVKLMFQVGAEVVGYE
jgi:transcription elongation factor Elf1